VQQADSAIKRSAQENYGDILAGQDTSHLPIEHNADFHPLAGQPKPFSQEK
jgi:hypothetical protein